MRTVISHFHNEAYLLVWWLQHHVKMFDHGIMIDYRSTDTSREVIATYAPTWDVVSTRNAAFTEPEASDEVEGIESAVDGWKIALNTTEFLCGDLDSLEAHLTTQEYGGARIRPIVMVDPPELRDVEPDPLRPLVLQRHYGFIQTSNPHFSYPDHRARLLHRHSTGDYGQGRHWSNHNDILGGGGATWWRDTYPPDVAVLWFHYAPWTSTFRARKANMPRADNPTLEQLESYWATTHGDVVDLRGMDEFIKAVGTWEAKYGVQCEVGLIGMDFDGVVTAGVVSDEPHVIISGRTFAEYDDLIKRFAQEVPVYIRGTGAYGDHQHAGEFKATMINLLGITQFHEDRPDQIAIIRTNCPDCIVISHDVGAPPQEAINIFSQGGQE